MIQASGSMAALMLVARRSRTGCHSQGLWLTNCWEALLVAVGEARRHGLDRLAAPVEQQAAQVGLAPAALVAAWQRGEHLRREGDQLAARLGKLRRPHELRVLGMVPPRATMISSPGFAAAQRRPAQANGVLLASWSPACSRRTSSTARRTPTTDASCTCVSPAAPSATPAICTSAGAGSSTPSSRAFPTSIRTR